MKILFYIINILTMIVCITYGWYIFIVGSNMENPYYMTIGLGLNALALICALIHNKYVFDDKIQEFNDKIKDKISKLCEE